MTPLLIFRARLYVFDEFLTKWSDVLRAETVTVMTARLMKEIDQYKVSFGPNNSCGAMNAIKILV